MTSPFDRVAATAFIVAQFRNEERNHPKPLYVDDVLPVLLSPDSEALAAPARETFPRGPELVRLRTRFFDDRFREAMARGWRQFVLLGSGGLDTRSVRFGEGRRYWEIDQEATLAFKAERYAEAGIRDPGHHVAGDYLRPDTIDRLTEAGLRLDEPVHLHWEGNTVYLQREAIASLLKRFAERLSTTRWTLDYMTRRVIDRASGNTELDRYIGHLTRMGAPWVTGFDGAEEIAAIVGGRVVEDASIDELQQQYREDDRSLAGYDFYHLAEIETAS